MKKQHHLQANFIKHHTDGEFDFLVNLPVYQTKTTESGQWINTNTGELCGKVVYLHLILTDGYNILRRPKFEEDLYELVP